MPLLHHLVLAALASTAFAAAAQAQTVYHWVDGSGQSHFSDTVPEAYRKVARPVGVASPDPTPAEQAAAEARAAALKATADAIVVPTVPTAGPARVGTPAKTEPAASAPIYDLAHCKAWQKRFAQSKACFDGATLADGSLVPGAFRTCGDDVPNPYPTCGAPDNADTDDAGFVPSVLTDPGRRRKTTKP